MLFDSLYPSFIASIKIPNKTGTTSLAEVYLHKLFLNKLMANGEGKSKETKESGALSSSKVMT
jgi:hypothetical protein